MEKDSNKFQFKYPLNNQLFAEDGSGDGNGGGNGDDGNPEVKTVSKELYDKTASELAKVKKELSKFRTDDQNREIEFQETKDQLEALRIHCLLYTS